MLVLTRKVGERIVIDENVEITVVQVRGNKVRLGVTAPRRVSIHRPEVRKRVEEVQPRQHGAPRMPDLQATVNVRLLNQAGCIGDRL